MQMRRVSPANRRYRYEVVAEIDENVHHIPIGEDISAAIGGAVNETIVMIATGHIMTYKSFGFI